MSTFLHFFTFRKNTCTWFIIVQCKILVSSVVCNLHNHAFSSLSCYKNVQTLKFKVPTSICPRATFCKGDVQMQYSTKSSNQWGEVVAKCNFFGNSQVISQVFSSYVTLWKARMQRHLPKCFSRKWSTWFLFLYSFCTKFKWRWHASTQTEKHVLLLLQCKPGLATFGIVSFYPSIYCNELWPFDLTSSISNILYHYANTIHLSTYMMLVK